ncbi:hypothetical protein SAMN05216436_1233 [bacterium A37T11]|nr:hypothetical protein SAMN05216436_1233 [bacterium A37T11]
MSLVEFLEVVLRDQPLVSRFEGRTIFLPQKTFPVVSSGTDGISTDQLVSANQSSPPVIFRVFDSEGKPLRGATFSFSSSKIMLHWD